MKSFIDRKVRLAFGFAILTLLLMGALSYRWVFISDESGRWVRHINDVLENIQDLSLAMETIESASRGFALTGKQSNLDRYEMSVSNAKQDLALIRALTADNPREQIHFPFIETLTAERIEHAELVVSLRRSQGMAAAAASVASWGDEPIKNEFQTITGKMHDDEEGLLTLRLAEADRERSQTRWILLFGVLLGVLITSFAARSVLAENAQRRIAEQTLQESEEKYRMLLDGIHDYAIIMLDPQGHVAGWSASAERMKGYSTEEIIGRKFSCLFSAEDSKHGIPEEVLQLAAANGRHEAVGILIRKDGSQFLGNVAITALRDATGTLRGFSEICRDLTEHKRSEARYRGLLEAAPDGLVVVNQAGKIVLLNARAEMQFGYRRDELLGQHVTNIILKGFAERLVTDGTRTVAEELAKQVGTPIELRGVRKDGTEFSIEIMLSPLESPEGILVTAAIRDITARKDAERQLAQAEARYRGLLEAAPDGMVVVNAAGAIVLLNAQAEKQFGYHRDELLGQNVKRIIPEGFAERLIADALRTNAEALAQQIGTGIELHGQRKDGSQFPIEIMLSPLESPEGVLVTAAIRDTSERKQLERQLHQSQKMEAVGQLTGGIAHDFNNLLTVIIGNLGLLDQTVSGNEAAVKRIRTAQKAAARGADITRRLLVFSSNVELKPAYVSLGDSIQNMIEMASRGLGLDVKITTQLDQSVPPLFVDPSALESALLNLVVNARDAMPNGGSIVISSKLKNLDESDPAVLAGDLKKGCYVCVSIADTGQGMSPEILERACEPFFTTKLRNKGTGLGLAMVYGFVKKSGGVVRISSVAGQGTTISLFLPIVTDPFHSLPAETVQPFNTKLSGTVLVVDDEVDVLEVAVAYLAEMGFATLQATDGASALETIMQHREIDLMITDMVMPGEIDGDELARRALVLRPELKIIHSSGFPAEAAAEKVMPVIDGPMLRKPYERAEFAAIVHSIMKDRNGRAKELENSHSGS
jgi:PAS domain S-box-containing protein